MKKSNLFLVLLTALIVMSCSKDETTMSIPQESNAIEFGTYVGRDAQTRGAEMNTAKLSTDHFGVLAYYTGQKRWEPVTEEEAASNAKAAAYPNFMYNQEIIGAATTDPTPVYTWSYSPIKYWPTTQNDKVSFFAYAPYESAPIGETSKGIKLSGNATADIGNPSITFTVKDSPVDMVDLVTASVMDVVGTENPSAVNFTFQHALSRVNFIAKASQLLLDAETDGKNRTIINITDVKLDGIDGGQFYKSGKYTLSSTDNKGVWSDQTEFTTSEGYDVAGILNKENAGHGIADNRYNASGIKLQTTDPVNLFKTSHYLFLIPPATALTASGATVTFTYDIVTIDDNLSPKYSKTTATKTVALPEGTLQQGVAYNYTFTFNVDQVVVTASVADWVTEDNPEVEKPVDVDYTHPI